MSYLTTCKVQTELSFNAGRVKKVLMSRKTYFIESFAISRKEGDR